MHAERVHECSGRAKVNLFTLCVVMLFTLTGCMAYREGRAEAHRDLEAGTLGRAEWGLVFAPASYREVLKKKYGIKRVGYGCEVDEYGMRWCEGYNDVMEPVIYDRFGPGVFEQALEDAKLLDEQRLGSRDEPKVMRPVPRDYGHFPY